MSRALEATAKAAKVRFLFSPQAQLALTDWQLAQFWLQEQSTTTTGQPQQRNEQASCGSSVGSSQLSTSLTLHNSVSVPVL